MKHTDTEEDTELHPLTFIRRLSAVQRPVVHTRSLCSVTNCRQDAVHNMHVNTNRNTHTFSLNALLCPRRSDLEMKRCINQTLPPVRIGPCKTDASQVTPHKSGGGTGTGSSGYILVSPHFSSFWSSWFFFCCSISLAVRLSSVCPSQMGAVLHFKPAALWESSTALPVGILVGYLRERVWSDQVPTTWAQELGSTSVTLKLR